MKTLSSLLLAVGVAACVPAAMATTIFNVYVSQPSEVSSFLAGAPGALTEDFNSVTPGRYQTSLPSSFGTYQFWNGASLAVQPADQYGGAGGSSYMAFGAQTGTSAPVRLDLNGNYHYFGFWWSAGDRNNAISFYDGNTPLGRFKTADLLTLLPSNGKVTDISGHQYDASAYYTYPNNPGEAYAYVHLISSGGTFNHVVFDNSGTTNSGFESDNHTLYAGTVTLPGTPGDQNLPSTIIFAEDDSNFAASAPLPSPEPGSAVLFTLGGTLVYWLRRRR